MPRFRYHPSSLPLLTPLYTPAMVLQRSILQGARRRGLVSRPIRWPQSRSLSTFLTRPTLPSSLRTHILSKPSTQATTALTLLRGALFSPSDSSFPWTQSSHPSLLLLQIRGAKRDTYKNSHRKRKRKLGFLARLRSPSGRRIIRRRKTKGCTQMSH